MRIITRLAGIRLLCFLVIIFLNDYTYAQGTWTPVATTAPHTSGGVMLLLTDGSVMVKTDQGGGQGKIWDKLTPDVHGSYINGTWTSLAPMTDDRLYFSTQVLKDGRVYVAGGEYGSGGPKSAVYDPLTNTWTACPQIVFSHNISDANSDLLADGRVLQAVVDTGGTKLNYYWDPATNTYSHAPSCIRGDNEAPWLKLPDQSILFVDNYGTTSERFLQSTNTWVNDGTVPVSLFDAFGEEAGAAFLLPNGKGFFIGSQPVTAYYTPSGSAAPGTWTAGPAIPLSQGAPDAAAAMMTNGIILMALSATPTSSNHFPSPTTFYEFDYTTNTFTAVSAPGGGATLPISSYITNMLDLPDGTVLYVTQGDNQFYEYSPATAPLPAGQPTVNTITRIACDTFMATGTLFNGICEGAAYGDDWQMVTNYPIIRLVSGTNVYYCRSKNWNSTGVMRGSAPDTAYFALPAGLPVGTYNLEVVANGNPSADFPVNTSLAISPATSSMCQGITETLTDVWSGGSWSSANTSIATVDPVSGLVTGIGGGVTTISYFMGTCFSTATVTINPAPATITPSGGINMCFGATQHLASATPGGNWSSSASTTASVGSSTGNVSGVAAGSATITYTAIGCYTTEDVTVNPLPAASISVSGPTSICPGSNVVLNAPSAAGNAYQWYLAGSPVAGATNVSYSATAAGSYMFKVISSAGCLATSSATPVSMLAAPAAAISITGPTTFCAGNSTLLTATSGAGLTYQWQSGGSPIAGATSNSYTATLGGTYTAVVTNTSGCSTASAGSVITVNPLPLPITGTLTVCSGATTSLSDGTSGGSWSSSNLAAATAGTGSGLVTGVGTGGVSTISYTLGTGCYATAVVTVNAAIAAAIAGPSNACTGQTMTLTDATPGGSWSSSATSIATVGSSGIVSGITPGSATISYAVVSACGTATVTKSISVSAPPAVAPITGTLTICSGLTSLLSDATISGVWSSTNHVLATVTTSGLVTALSPGLDTIGYSVTNTSGCTTTAMAVFNVFSGATSSITAAGPTSFCTGAYVVLNALSGTGITYQWKKNGINITGATSASYNAGTSGSYAAQVTLPGGCNGTSAPIVVTVSPSPVVVPSVAISATAGPVFCTTFSPATFTAIPSNGGPSPAYQWFVNGAGVGTANSFSYTPATGDIVECAMTSDANCAFPLSVSVKDTMSVSPMRTPSVTITSSPAEICAGNTITFIANPVYGGTAPTYRWSRNDTNVATGYGYVYIPHYGDVLKVILFSDYPCLLTDTAVSPQFTIHPIAPVLNTISVSVTQSALVAGSVDTFIALAPNGGTAPAFQWRLNGSPISGATNSIYITNTLTAGEIISCEETSNKPCATPETAISGGITVRVIPAGVQQLSSNGTQFSLVPNPNKGTFAITGILKDNTATNACITITDLLGQNIYSQIFEIQNGILNHQIILGSQIANGIFLVNITSGAEHYIYRIVVDK